MPTKMTPTPSPGGGLVAGSETTGDYIRRLAKKAYAKIVPPKKTPTPVPNPHATKGSLKKQVELADKYIGS